MKLVLIYKEHVFGPFLSEGAIADHIRSMRWNREECEIRTLFHPFNFGRLFGLIMDQDLDQDVETVAANLAGIDHEDLDPEVLEPYVAAQKKIHEESKNADL